MAGLLSLEDLINLKKQGVAEVPRVELFGSGLHREGEQPYTRDDMAALCRNFSALSTGTDPRVPVPVTLGHDEEQPWLDDGMPAAGWVTHLWQEPGGLLCCKFSDLPSSIAKSVDQGIYRGVSAVIDPEPPFGCPGQGMTLREVALTNKPQLKWLSKKLAVRNYQERFKRRPNGGLRIYSEAIMDQATKDTLIAVIKGKWPDFPDSVLSTMTDEQLQELATAATPAAAAADGTVAADMPPRDQMVQEIIAADPMQDQATLEAMPDADLFALWQQLVGGTQMSEGAAKPAGTPPTPKPPTPKPPAPGPVPAPGTPVTPTTPPGVADAAAASYAEATRRQEVRLAALEASSKRAYAETVRREKAERARTVKAYCERWTRDGFVLPREVDAGSKVPNLYHRLMAADAHRVRKYGETSTNEFDSLVQEIESRGPNFVRRHFSEQVPDPVGAGGINDVAAQAKKYAEARNKHATRRAG